MLFLPSIQLTGLPAVNCQANVKQFHHLQWNPSYWVLTDYHHMRSHSIHYFSTIESHTYTALCVCHSFFRNHNTLWRVPRSTWLTQKTSLLPWAITLKKHKHDAVNSPHSLRNSLSIVMRIETLKVNKQRITPTTHKDSPLPNYEQTKRLVSKENDTIYW